MRKEPMSGSGLGNIFEKTKDKFEKTTTVGAT